MSFVTGVTSRRATGNFGKSVSGEQTVAPIGQPEVKAANRQRSELTKEPNTCQN
jgi:hypothetical protein